MYDYKTFNKVDPADKELVRQMLAHLKNLTDVFEQIAYDQIDSTEHPEEMKDQAKSALKKQYDVFRFILDTVIVVDPASENELPS